MNWLSGRLLLSTSDWGQHVSAVLESFIRVYLFVFTSVSILVYLTASEEVLETGRVTGTCNPSSYNSKIPKPWDTKTSLSSSDTRPYGVSECQCFFWNLLSKVMMMMMILFFHLSKPVAINNHYPVKPYKVTCSYPPYLGGYCLGTMFKGG